MVRLHWIQIILTKGKKKIIFPITRIHVMMHIIETQISCLGELKKIYMNATSGECLIFVGGEDF